MRLSEIKERNGVEKEEIYKTIIDFIVMQDGSFLERAMNNPELRPVLSRKISKIISEGKLKSVEEVKTEDVMEYIDYIMNGYGVLDQLIDDPEISDIKVYDYNKIRVKKLGKRMSTNVQFKDEKDYLHFVDMIAIKNKIPLSVLNAIQTFTDKKTNDKHILRINISTGMVNSTEKPYVQIRKIPKFKYKPEQLIEFKMFNDDVMNYLINAAKESGGLLFVGKGASGKTTMMNFLLDYIPEYNSALVVQENEELFSTTHPDMMFQHVVTARGEGRVAYSLEDLARNGLLIDLDYYIIGEIKGDEAAHLMMANFTGHKAWTSVHGKSAKEGIYKLADYVKQATDYSLSDSMMMLSGIETVVFMKDFKVNEIIKCNGYDDGKLNMETVYRYNRETDKWDYVEEAAHD